MQLALWDRWVDELPDVRMLDHGLVASFLLLLVWGLVMVASSSVAIGEQEGSTFFYFWRQLAYAGLGVTAGVLMFLVPLSFWQHRRMSLLATAFALLVVVFVPGIGREVNGAQRWIDLGPVNLQTSELARLALLGYLAAFLSMRRSEMTQNWRAVFRPLTPILLACVLLLTQPDFGATVVLMSVSLVLVFLAGAPVLMMGGAVVAGAAALGILAIASPYRMRRLVSFTDPWQDPYDSGFQLSQSLIAIGRGEWMGVGLGNSVQKLFYLPEQHTDFIYAIMAEEYGLFGTVLLLLLFLWFVRRAFAIASRALAAGQEFGALLAYALGTWMGLQVLINLGVNMGILPTKGLTLPFMSYGGSSMLAACMAVGLLLRVDYESLHLLPQRKAGRQP